MPNTSAPRFQFIAHALNGTGPFRPSVSVQAANNGGTAATATVSDSALISYPREGILKFARRNQLAFYASPLARACARFGGFLSSRRPSRTLTHKFYDLIVDDVDGKGNAIDVFWSDFVVNAKARGSMLLLVDMPAAMANSMADQLAERVVPYWTSIYPENVGDYEVGDDGKFDFVEFDGNFTRDDGARTPCTWRFDRDTWSAKDREGRVLGGDEHGLPECPVLIFTEGNEFPHFGAFSPIADMGRRLFNLDSELDEILRSQTFSLLTMQAPDGATNEEKLAAAKVAGETIGTQNLLVHSGTTPAFIAPDSGPAETYLKRIDQINQRIDDIAMKPSGSSVVESGLALQMRFRQLNAELARFAGKMEDLERRAWEISRRWLSLSVEVEVQWPRDFDIADVETEMKVLADMQAAGMPQEVIAEQQKRIVSLQFSGLDEERMQEIFELIDERSMQPTGEARGVDGNVIPLRPDPNAPVRDAIVKALGANGGA